MLQPGVFVVVYRPHCRQYHSRNVIFKGKIPRNNNNGILLVTYMRGYNRL